MPPDSDGRVMSLPADRAGVGDIPPATPDGALAGDASRVANG